MRNQSGAVLIISLAVLLLISLVGLSGASSTTMEERMAGNFRDQKVAFEAAESALGAAEAWVEANDIDPIVGSICIGTECFTADCSDGLCFNGTISGGMYPQCDHQEPAVPVYGRDNPLDVWGNSARHRVVGTGGTLTGAQAGGRFVVEFICYSRLNPSAPMTASMHGSASFFSDFAEMYRITASAVGATPNSSATVQSTYLKIR